MANVYYYDGIPLKEYCENNGLNFKTISSRIFKLRKNPDYCKCSADELVDLAIKQESAIKYYYKGKTLAAYCLENNLNYSTILSKINLLKKDVNNKDLDDTELIEKVIGQTYNRNAKYTYKGISLSKYCSTTGENYSKMLARIRKMANDEAYKHYTNEQLTKMAIDNERELKYSYEGESLYKYCQKNNLKYISIISRIFRARKNPKYDSYNDDELVKMVVKKEMRLKFFYKGVPLAVYCKENNLNYVPIRIKVKEILSDERYSNLSIDEAVDMVLNKTYKKERKKFIRTDGKYFINGVPMKKYCEDHGIDLLAIKARIYRLKHDEKYLELSDDEIAQMAINSFEDKRIKYVYKGMSLTKYCKTHKLSCFDVLKKLKLLKENGIEITQEDIDRVILETKNDKKQKDFLLDIKNKEDYYKVNYKNVELLSKKINVFKAFKIVQLFGDEIDSRGNRFISDKGFAKVKQLINNVRKDDSLIEVMDLIKLYRCKLYDARDLILMKKENYINTVVDSLCEENDLSLNDFDIADLKSVGKMACLEALKDENLDIDNYIKEEIVKYLNQYVDNTLRVNVNVDSIDWRKDDLSEKQGLVKKYANCLDEKEIMFLKLIYEDDYSYEDMENVCGVSKNRILKKEKEILDKIRCYSVSKK